MRNVNIEEPPMHVHVDRCVHTLRQLRITSGNYVSVGGGNVHKEGVYVRDCYRGREDCGPCGGRKRVCARSCV